MEGDGGLHSVVVLTEWISIHALRVEGDRHPLTRFRDRWHFYPRPPGGGRPRRGGGVCGDVRISIHALRVEGDTRLKLPVMEMCDFYPRPPGGGRRAKMEMGQRRRNFYPRPPGGGRRHLRGD